MVPDFSEFLSSLDPDEIGSKINELHLSRIYQLQDNGQLTEPIIGLIQELYRNSVADACQIFTRVYLEEYHNRLQEYLE